MDSGIGAPPPPASGASFSRSSGALGSFGRVLRSHKKKGNEGYVFPTEKDCMVIRESWRIITDPNRSRRPVVPYYPTSGGPVGVTVPPPAVGTPAAGAAAAAAAAHGAPFGLAMPGAGAGGPTDAASVVSGGPGAAEGVSVAEASIAVTAADAALSPAMLFTYAFYTHLLDQSPYLRPMFSDIGKQSSALSGLLEKVVKDVDKLMKLRPVVRRLGYKHHAVYGVTPPMYNAVGRSLTATVREWMLADGTWSPEIDWAWEAVYNILATWMKEGYYMTGDESNEGVKKEKCTIL
ncbi:hypothetical protein CXG81DRAFT_23389 [Caulochytrium protostelioides]|uniref:Globin domain-containing protein n=1 Tax=Caulochytrium protostelioides TaxID=1555241 RepID=A0A4P9XEJ5_9FUNG|nr:hypothetical protein CXG81DRAFT_23389 [Caulochytrium protostelioides]|eukprot:RKP03977.1 hypothetical protein CXG81DRAFT_23389 [Caulochytrium protostelioides]